MEGTFYEDLSNTELEIGRNEINDAYVLNNIEKIKLAFEDNENEDGKISNKVSEDIGEKIMDKTIEHDLIPDDNHEATINSYYEAEDINLDFKELEYYGNGQFSISFNLHIRVSVLYYLFKSDYYSLEHAPSVSDHNKHYYEAEDEFEVIVTVTGTVSIAINQDNLNLDNFSESIELDSRAIDEIQSIKLVEEQKFKILISSIMKTYDQIFTVNEDDNFSLLYYKMSTLGVSYCPVLKSGTRECIGIINNINLISKLPPSKNIFPKLDSGKINYTLNNLLKKL